MQPADSQKVQRRDEGQRSKIPLSLTKKPGPHALREQGASARGAHLEGLHLRLGFASRAELIVALVALDGRDSAGAQKAGVSEAAPAQKRGRGRPRIDGPTTAGVLKALIAGGSGTAVAKDFGLARQTVHNMKKAAGLVHARK